MIIVINLLEFNQKNVNLNQFGYSLFYVHIVFFRTIVAFLLKLSIASSIFFKATSVFPRRFSDDAHMYKLSTSKSNPSRSGLKKNIKKINQTPFSPSLSNCLT